MRSLYIFASLMVGLCQSIAVQADSWRVGAAMPMGVQEIYADSFGGLVYVGGGIPKDQNNFTDQFLSYDAKSDQWKSLKPVPERRHHLSIAATGGKVYGMGGFTGALPNWYIHRKTFIYDIASNVWTSGPEMPTARAEHTASVVDGKIVLIGGRVAEKPDADNYADYIDTNIVDIFDTKTGTWSRASESPTARNSHAAAVIDGKIYVVGGRQLLKDSSGGFKIANVAFLEVYDPKTDRWEKKSPMPVAQGGLAAAALNGKLYVFGGEQFYPEKRVFGNCWVYEPSLDRWSPLPSLPTPRHGLAAAAVGNEIAVIGGASKPGLGAINTNNVLSID